jgi:hypothetical protein
MPVGIPARVFRNHRGQFLATLTIAIVTVAGFESVTHGHMPAEAGWHDATPHGPMSHDEGLKPCSICRLAHECSVATAAAMDVNRPEVVVDFPAPTSEGRSLSVLVRERSPRAPPQPAAC